MKEVAVFLELIEKYERNYGFLGLCELSNYFIIVHYSDEDIHIVISTINSFIFKGAPKISVLLIKLLKHRLIARHLRQKEGG